MIDRSDCVHSLTTVSLFYFIFILYRLSLLKTKSQIYLWIRLTCCHRYFRKPWGSNGGFLWMCLAWLQTSFGEDINGVFDTKLSVYDHKHEKEILGPWTLCTAFLPMGRTDKLRLLSLEDGCSVHSDILITPTTVLIVLYMATDSGPHESIKLKLKS